MRVAVLAPGYGAAHGVLGRHVEALSSGAARDGGHVEVFVHDLGHRESPADEDGVCIDRLWPWTVFHASRPTAHANPAYRAARLDLRRALSRFDIVHVHADTVLAGLLKRYDGLPPVIFTPHWYASSPTHLRRLAQGQVHGWERRVLARADLVLCVSQSEAVQVRRYAPHTRVEIVPNGFDTDSIAHAKPFALEPRLILSVDRLTHWAGIHRIISALPALAPSYRLIIVGGGRGRGALEAHADHLGVADRVTFVGGVNDGMLRRWLRTSSVVTTLKEESLWGGTLLTAACAGVPVVASDISAHREAAALIGNEGIEFVSRRASPFAVATAIRQVAGNGIRPAAALVPTWEDAVEGTIDIYREMAGNGR
jgi:glycosyltransferase involved in cell wall biosynthesis